ILAGLTGHSACMEIPDRREAIRQVIRNAEAGEMILLCGKGHETYEIRGKTKTPFDEAEIVRDAVSSRNRSDTGYDEE
ncbi:MAG: hypothetical protein IJB15_05825, partial [Clostridia bacterium]|nr:hypothetical protein [Clostridia bacterium]